MARHMTRTEAIDIYNGCGDGCDATYKSDGVIYGLIMPHTGYDYEGKIDMTHGGIIVDTDGVIRWLSNVNIIDIWGRLMAISRGRYFG